MLGHDKLTNALVADPTVFRAAVLSNKVDPPRLHSCAFAGIAALRISAIRYAAQHLV